MNKLSNIKSTLLLGPGPSTVAPSVYKALSTNTIGHLDPRFIEIMDEIKKLLRIAFKTENDFCMPISGTGSAAMETCFVNIIDPGDKILIIQNGYFSLRMENMCTRLGANIDVLKFEWGKTADLNIVSDKIKNNSYDIVAVVHAETSTGVRNNVKEILKKYPAINSGRKNYKTQYIRVLKNILMSKAYNVLSKSKKLDHFGNYKFEENLFNEISKQGFE